jgi:hypothetical protein
MSNRIEVVVATAPASGPLPWELRETVDVARPAEEAFAFVTQPENVPRDQLLLQIRGAVAEQGLGKVRKCLFHGFLMSVRQLGARAVDLSTPAWV